MGTSTLRFAIIVALVVGGVLLIDQAFPEGQAGTLPRPTETTPPPGTPTPTATQTGQQGDGEGEAPAGKVVVGVYNGTFTTGLAGTTADQLSKKPSYRVPGAAVGDTPSKPWNETTIYFRTPDDRAAAEALVEDFFVKRDLPDVTIEPMPNDLDVPESVDLAIYLGTDFV